MLFITFFLIGAKGIFIVWGMVAMHITVSRK